MDVADKLPSSLTGQEG